MLLFSGLEKEELLLNKKMKQISSKHKTGLQEKVEPLDHMDMKEKFQRDSLMMMMISSWDLCWTPMPLKQMMAVMVSHIPQENSLWIRKVWDKLLLKYSALIKLSVKIILKTIWRDTLRKHGIISTSMGLDLLRLLKHHNSWDLLPQTNGCHFHERNKESSLRLHNEWRKYWNNNYQLYWGFPSIRTYLRYI